MILYRGENILNGRTDRVNTFKRLLRNGLPLDFINGGNPYRVQQLGFFDATVSHVANNNLGVGANGFKHFISFSEAKSTAEGYAISYNGGAAQNTYPVLEDYYTADLNSYQNQDIWEDTQHLIIELDISSGTPVHATAPCLKSISYNGGANRIIALDVVSYLTTQLQRIGQPSAALLQQFPNVLPHIKQALRYAITDKEWLIGCLDPIATQIGVRPSFSALISHGAILSVMHHMAPDYFTRP